jgi:hypothetical protein
MGVQIAYQRKLTPSQFKAWSQILGHENLLTTLASYGKMPLEMQGQFVAKSAVKTQDDKDIAAAIEIAKIFLGRKLKET